MPVPSESIQVGKCYLTTSSSGVPRVRRVIEILPDGRVQYEQRTPKAPWREGLQYKDVFAAIVAREVPCDWTPKAEEA